MFAGRNGVISTPRAASQGTAVRLGEEQHVADDPGQPVQVLEIRPEDLAKRLDVPRLPQGVLAAEDQGRQRGRQFVSHVRVEALELFVGAIQPFEQAIELLDERGQLGGLGGAIELSVEGTGGQRTGLVHQLLHRTQAHPHEQIATG